MSFSFYKFIQLILSAKSTKRFFIGAVLSFGFSISVILSTIGLMDGFENTLLDSLNKSSSDIIIRSKKGFFDQSQVASLNRADTVLSSFILAQGFVVSEEGSRGVAVHGIDDQSFARVTGLAVSGLKDQELAVGSELATQLKVQEGDYVDILIANSSNLTPEIITFQVAKIVEHGIYEKNLRFVYIPTQSLAEALQLKAGRVNRSYLKGSFESKSDIQYFVDNQHLPELILTPFWEEYKNLLNAIEVEKFSITIILQVIVLVSVFNILGFVYFVMERQTQNFFLLSALGVSRKKLGLYWLKVIGAIWSLAVVVAIGLTFLFDFLLQRLSIFELPGNIYVLSKLQLDISLDEFGIVMIGTIVWLSIIGLLCFFKINKLSIIDGLRQEFS